MHPVVGSFTDGTWGDVIGGMAATLALALVLLLHRRVERKVNSIDKAVNSRPDTDPKLYEIASTAANVAKSTRAETHDAATALGRKIDKGFEQVNRRFDTIDRRCNAIDDRVDAIDRRSDANATAIDRLDATKVDRG